jgi:hypothetical protein
MPILGHSWAVSSYECLCALNRSDLSALSNIRFFASLPIGSLRSKRPLPARFEGRLIVKIGPELPFSPTWMSHRSFLEPPLTRR